MIRSESGSIDSDIESYGNDYYSPPLNETVATNSNTPMVDMKLSTVLNNDSNHGKQRNKLRKRKQESTERTEDGEKAPKQNEKRKLVYFRVFKTTPRYRIRKRANQKSKRHVRHVVRKKASERDSPSTISERSLKPSTNCK